MILTAEERTIITTALRRLAVDVDRGDTFGDAEFIRDLRTRVLRSNEPYCEHPDLLPSMDAPHPRREREAYEAWLDRPKRCHHCGADVPERDL